MSKIVNWGHWVVGLLACAIAVESIWAIIHNTVAMGRSRGETFGAIISDANVLFFCLALATALCAWGIFRWQSWGYVLALGISAFELFAGAEAVMVGDASPLFPLVPLLVVVWLLLPAVRAAYWRQVSV